MINSWLKPKIDEINDRLIDLLRKRGNRVVQVRHFKKDGRTTRPPQIGLRPAVIEHVVNDVLGPENWSYAVEMFGEPGKKELMVTIGFRSPDGDWFWGRPQFGEVGNSGKKGELTNAVGKALSQFDIGWFAYAGLIVGSGDRNDPQAPWGVFTLQSKEEKDDDGGEPETEIVKDNDAADADADADEDEQAHKRFRSLLYSSYKQQSQDRIRAAKVPATKVAETLKVAQQAYMTNFIERVAPGLNVEFAVKDYPGYDYAFDVVGRQDKTVIDIYSVSANCLARLWAVRQEEMGKKGLE